MISDLPHITNCQFNKHMVRALLWGWKTNTRRIPNARWNKVRPGSWIYVREHWRTRAAYDYLMPTELAHLTQVSYQADYDQEPNEGYRGKFRQAMHMPRWASRVSLLVTDVRKERIQDIRRADAVAEGLQAVTKGGCLFKYGIPEIDRLPGVDGWPWREWEVDPRDAFAKLWDSLHGKKPGEAWADNPEVIVTAFKVVNTPIEKRFPQLLETWRAA